MWQTALVGLGGNVGDSSAVLEGALALLREAEGVSVVAVSSFRLTEPVGGPPGQPPYLNAVVEMRTDLAPADLLHLLQRVERAMGRDRTREVRWGPRACDLDLLLMGDTVIDTPELTLPHPRMHLRRFVLEPLVELVPEAVHPRLGRSARQMLDALEKGS